MGRLDPEHAQMVALANAAAPPLKGFFGVVCIAGWLGTDDPSGNASRTLRSSCPMVGTLAQIRKIAVGGAGETRLVATGRTRFTVKDPWSLLDGTDTGVVGVVFDVEVELLSDSAERPKMRRVFGDAGGSSLSKPRLGLTPHSASTYELFDPRALARRLRASPSLAVALGCAVRSRDISTTAKADDAKRDVEDDLPLDPALLSHRVASRAPVSLRTRYKLLCCDTVVDRLRLECKLFDVFSSSSSAFPDDDIGRHSTPANIYLSVLLVVRGALEHPRVARGDLRRRRERRALRESGGPSARSADGGGRRSERGRAGGRAQRRVLVVPRVQVDRRGVRQVSPAPGMAVYGGRKRGRGKTRPETRRRGSGTDAFDDAPSILRAHPQRGFARTASRAWRRCATSRRLRTRSRRSRSTRMGPGTRD